MIKLIAFDFDGVIEDTYESHFELSKKMIKDLTIEEHKILFDGNVHEQREKLKHRDTGFDVPGKINEQRDNLNIKPEIKDELIELSKKFTLGIISSGKESGIKKYLKNNNLEVFSFIYGVETHKSKIEKFKMAMNNYNIKPDEIIFVTDTLGDILEAKKVDIRTIAVDFGYHEPARLEKGNPIKIVSSFKEIMPALESIS